MLVMRTIRHICCCSLQHMFEFQGRLLLDTDLHNFQIFYPRKSWLDSSLHIIVKCYQRKAVGLLGIIKHNFLLRDHQSTVMDIFKYRTLFDYKRNSLLGSILHISSLLAKTMSWLDTFKRKIWSNYHHRLGLGTQKRKTVCHLKNTSMVDPDI